MHLGKFQHKSPLITIFVVLVRIYPFWDIGHRHYIDIRKVRECIVKAITSVRMRYSIFDRNPTNAKSTEIASDSILTFMFTRETLHH